MDPDAAAGIIIEAIEGTPAGFPDDPDVRDVVSGLTGWLRRGGARPVRGDERGPRDLLDGPQGEGARGPGGLGDEDNIRYVAATRAKEILNLVRGPAGETDHGFAAAMED